MKLTVVTAKQSTSMNLNGLQKCDQMNCDCEKNEIAKDCWKADHNFGLKLKDVVDWKAS